MESKIFDAVVKGDTSVVRDFLSREVDVNLESSYYEMTLLQAAVQSLRPEVVQCLVDKGADVNLKNRDGEKAIEFISHDLKPNSDAEIVLKILITAGADINSRSGIYSIKSLLHLAIENNNLELVKYLIQRGANIDARDCQGQTPLHYVFREYFSTDLLGTLLSAGADVNTEDDYGETPLFSLIKTVQYFCKIPNLDNNVPDIFDLLLKQKANFTLKNYKNCSLMDVVFIYSNNNKRTTAIVKALIQQCGFSVDVKWVKTDPDIGHSILHFASLKDNKPLVKFLLENGVFIDILDNLDMTPLASTVLVARGRSHFKIIKYLLKHNADVNTITNFGCNTLDCAESVNSNRSRSWKIIIEHFAKLEVTGHKLHASIMKTIEKNPRYSYCYRYSIKELEKLKDHKLSPKHWLSLYNFLVDHKKKLVSYVQNPIVVKELQNIIVTIDQKYQRYGTEIKERFVKAMINKNVLNRSAVVLSMLLSSHLSCNIRSDNIVIEKILDYCEFKYLKRLCNTFMN